MTELGVQPSSNSSAPQRGGHTALAGADQLSPHRGNWLIATLVCLGILVGAAIVPAFGMSTDEYHEAKLGADALRVYQGSQDYFHDDSLEDHGPVYFMLFSATSQILTRVYQGWTLPDGRHFTNYLTFLIGVYCFYWINLQLIRRTPALMATALFATQPLLFGSSFINHKDIPFMTLFMGVLALGLKAGSVQRSPDNLGKEPSPGGGRTGNRRFGAQVKAEWLALGPRKRLVLVVASVCGFLIVMDLNFFGLVHRWGTATIEAAFEGRAIWPVQSLFSQIAKNAYRTPMASYLGKYDSYFGVLKLAITGLLLAGGFVTYSLAFPSSRSLWLSDWSKRRYPTLVAGAVVLGIAICVRQIGLFAGGLASIYLLYRGRGKAVIPLFLYWAIAGVVMYATWPYLWSDPIARMAESISVVQTFEPHSVLFQGQLLSSADLPWSYFPTLAALKLTEPALFLGFLGLGILAWRFKKRQADRAVVVLLALWVGVPVGWVISQGTPIYGGIRQLLFVLPPFLTAAGVAIDAFFILAHRLWVRSLFVGLMLVPGLWAIAWLHPYEYAYFNSLGGGVGGAYGYFDEDYWCTSLKETAEVVNQVAAPGESVIVYGPAMNFAVYARRDLNIVSEPPALSEASLVAVCTDKFSGKWDSSKYRLIYQVQRGGAIFAEVWQLGAGAVPTGSAP
jgi:hypothetical protein